MLHKRMYLDPFLEKLCPEKLDLRLDGFEKGNDTLFLRLRSTMGQPTVLFVVDADLPVKLGLTLGAALSLWLHDLSKAHLR